MSYLSNRTHQDDPVGDGYIECTQCGHTLERNHDEDGCQQPECTCTEAWTAEEIEQIRRELGMVD